MKKTFESLEHRLQQHLEEISQELEHDDGFKCHQQVDDVRDCLQSLHFIHQLSSTTAMMK